MLSATIGILLGIASYYMPLPFVPPIIGAGLGAALDIVAIIQERRGEVRKWGQVIAGIAAIGTDDTLASPGAQLDYYQSVIDKMGRAKVDSFARLYVIPQVGHSLRGNTYSSDGEGKPIPVTPIPSAFDRVQLLIDWVEHASAPGTSIAVTAGDKSMPMCSYPMYPKYVGRSFTCAEN